MRHVLLLLAVACAPLAADPTGRWIGHDGKRELNLLLRQESGRLSGNLITPMTDFPLEDVRADGRQLTWVIRTGIGGVEKRIIHTASLARSELRVKREEGGPGGGWHEIVFHRVSKNPALPQNLAYPAPQLPPYRDVPPNGLAKTPPMGWSSWNHFGEKIDDRTVREVADAMATNGMLEAGYIYVNIDDGWQGKRDAQGVLQPNERFPDMKALADYVHDKGLKLGIYSSPGPKTCAGFEGSYLHEEQDARTFAAWGIDYLKYDWCSGGRVYKPVQMRAAYQKMGEALLAAGRPIVYSICQYGLDSVWEWAPEAGGNLWRTNGDIGDSWASMREIGFRQNGVEKWAGPGRWNDPDMLEVGNGGMTTTEYQTHMSLWAMLAAPLLAGNDVRSMTAETRDILLNHEVIAVDQDPVGKPGRRLTQYGEVEIWIRDLAPKSSAIALFNLGSEPAKFHLNFSDVHLDEALRVRDLWAHRDLDLGGAVLPLEIEPHGVVFLRVEKQ